MSEGKNLISEEEARLLFAQFTSDIQSWLPEYGEEDLLIQRQNRQDAARHALTLAIQRERERCAAICEALITFDSEHEKHIKSPGLDESDDCGWCEGLEKAAAKIRGEKG